MREKYIIGNWKMNKTVSESVSIINSIKARLEKFEGVKVVVCPPFTSLDTVHQKLADTKILLGAQNVYYVPSGAYTGEISVEMLKDIGVTYCIIGHSERRQYFGETDETVNKKMEVLLDNNITPVLCVGESLEQRKNEEYKDFVEMQLRKAYSGIDSRKIEKSIIAYEPIWAIGTGATATPDIAQDMCEFIRYTIKKMYGEDVAGKISILYGGSVNLSNIKEIMDEEDIDGVLVGGACLKPEFADMVLTCEKNRKENV